MPSRFVLDASLLEKYSLVDRPINSPISIDEMLVRLINENRHWNVFAELKSLIDLLDAVMKGQAVICLNNKIIYEYSNYLGRIPYEIEEYFLAILSDDTLSIRIDHGGFTREDFYEIKDTKLESKEIYLDLAKTLRRRIIVSTEEDKNNIYMSNSEILLKHGILCRTTWECSKYLHNHIDFDSNYKIE